MSAFHPEPCSSRRSPSAFLHMSHEHRQWAGAPTATGAVAGACVAAPAAPRLAAAGAGEGLAGGGGRRAAAAHAAAAGRRVEHAVHCGRAPHLPGAPAQCRAGAHTLSWVQALGVAMPWYLLLLPPCTCSLDGLSQVSGCRKVSCTGSFCEAACPSQGVEQRCGLAVRRSSGLCEGDLGVSPRRRGASASGRRCVSRA